MKDYGGSDSQFEELFGLRKHTIAEWRQGTLSTYMNILPQIAEKFNVTTDYLLGYQKIFPDFVDVPIIGKIQAGYPIESSQTKIGTVKVPFENVLTETDVFALEVVGDSMMPIVLEGDIIICKKRGISSNGKICVVTIDNESTLKRVRIDGNGKGITLIPTNPMYKELYYSASDVIEKNITIDGVLVQMIRNF